MSIYLRRFVASFLVIGLALHVSFEALSGRSMHPLAALVLPMFAFPYLCLSASAIFTCRSITLACLLAALLVLFGFDLFHWRDWASPAPEASIGSGIIWLFECGFSVAVTLLAFLLGVVVPPSPSNA